MLMVLEKAPGEVGQIWRHALARGMRGNVATYVRVTKVMPNGFVVWSDGTSTMPKELEESPDWERVSGDAAERLVEGGGAP